MSSPSLIADGRRERVVTVWGRDYRPDNWPYGSGGPFYYTDEQYVEALILGGFATARILYMRGVYTAEEMEAHMEAAIETPLFGSLCPHRVLPDNCSRCCGCEEEWWMRP